MKKEIYLPNGHRYNVDKDINNFLAISCMLRKKLLKQSSLFSESLSEKESKSNLERETKSEILRLTQKRLQNSLKLLQLKYNEK